MTLGRHGLVLAATLALVAAFAGRAAAEPLKVVASFSILGDFVAEVGGPYVSVTTLVGPNGDPHVFQPSPADVRKLAAADLVVVNGLGFEGWLDRLVEASGYRGAIAIASNGVTPLMTGEGVHAHDEHAAKAEHVHQAVDEHDHAGVDPHAWQSVANAEIYVKNVAATLCAADRAHCAEFEANAASYSAELERLDADIEAGLAQVPPERRKIITSHDAFTYLARAYRIEIIAAQGASTESEASAADVAALIRQARAEGVTALFVENISDPRLIELIARETGVKPGGKLYTDALSEPDGPAPTYVEMMRHNAGLLQAALQGS
jgi:zinc/manganese transport system substrate-binding protein